MTTYKELYYIEKNNESLLSFIREWIIYDTFDFETQKLIRKDVMKSLSYLKDSLDEGNYEDINHETADFILNMNNNWGSSRLLSENEFNIEEIMTNLMDDVQNCESVISLYNDVYKTKYDKTKFYFLPDE